MENKLRVKDFGQLGEFLMYLPDHLPELTINRDEDGDIHFEWYFGEGNYVQLSIGDNFRDGVLYNCFKGKFDKTDYTHAKLISLLLEQI
jgi:hypothetical protein